MEKYLAHFGQRLRQLRSKEGLTQKELADKLGVGQGHIATLENAKEGRRPSLDFLIDVSRFFGVGLDDLIGTLPPPPTELESLPADLRGPIEELITQLSRDKRDARWRTLSSTVQALGGSAAVERASRQTGVALTPEDAPALITN